MQKPYFGLSSTGLSLLDILGPIGMPICRNTCFRHTDLRWFASHFCWITSHFACRSRCAGKRRMRARPVKMRRACRDWDGLSTDGCIKNMDYWTIYTDIDWIYMVCCENSMDGWFSENSWVPRGQVLSIQTHELCDCLVDICGNVAVQFASTLIYPWKLFLIA